MDLSPFVSRDLEVSKLHGRMPVPDSKQAEREPEDVIYDPMAG